MGWLSHGPSSAWEAGDCRQDPALRRGNAYQQLAGQGKDASATAKSKSAGERFINDDAKVKSGGRKAARISEEELHAKIVDAAKGFDPDVDEDDLDYAVYCMFQTMTVAADNKYGMSTENAEIEDRAGSEEYLGIHTVGDLTYCGALVAGDWEVPAFTCVYFDGRKLRMYMPTYGNPVNAIEKCGIGSELNDESNKYKAKYQKLGAWDESEYGVEVDYPAIYGENRDEVSPHWEAVEKDFTSRIVVE